MRFTLMNAKLHPPPVFVMSRVSGRYYRQLYRINELFMGINIASRRSVEWRYTTMLRSIAVFIQLAKLSSFRGSTSRVSFASVRTDTQIVAKL